MDQEYFFPSLLSFWSACLLVCSESSAWKSSYLEVSACRRILTDLRMKNNLVVTEKDADIPGKLGIK